MYKQTLIDATNAGAKELKRFFHGKFMISHKEGINNLVTEADHASDKAIHEIIKSAFPNDGIISEESLEVTSKSDYVWIVDPIDGTVNFANGIPLCCVSIGIQYKGSMLMGAVYNPIMDEFYFAEKGKGATLNGTQISVSDKTEVTTSCLVTGFPYRYLDKPNGPLEVFEKLIKGGIPVRRLGSAAMDLCWVAAGRFDGFYEHELHAWDSAAGFLIVEEAGGRVTDMQGDLYSPFQPGIIATNGKIHEELQKIIAGAPLQDPVIL